MHYLPWSQLKWLLVIEVIVNRPRLFQVGLRSVVKTALQQPCFLLILHTTPYIAISLIWIIIVTQVNLHYLRSLGRFSLIAALFFAKHSPTWSTLRTRTDLIFIRSQI